MSTPWRTPDGAENARAPATSRPIIRLLLILLLPLAARAEEGRELPRKILAFYNKKAVAGSFKDVYFTQLHQRAELPLNHLGMDLVYRDVGEPLPSLASLAGYRGVLTWFERGVNFTDPDPFCLWLSSAMASGFKVVIMGDPGLGRTGKPREGFTPPCRAMFLRLGARVDAPISPADPIYIEILGKDSAMVEHERRLTADELTTLPMVEPLSGTTSFVVVRYNDEPARLTRPVLLSEAGGLALSPFATYSTLELEAAATAAEGKAVKAEPDSGRTDADLQVRWRVEPFSFFEAAFGLRGRPRPDTTTVNGRRLFLSQVDGDGFFNVSEVDKRSWSGEIFLKEVLERYPDSPFTVSLITGYYETPRYGRPESLELSRKVLGQPNVEPASHGRAHPLIWHKETVAVQIPGYRYSPKAEILDSLAFINSQLLAPGRRAELFLWTGNALPREADLRAPLEAGFLTINGGPTRFDRTYDSVGFVFPIGRRVGSLLQIYAPDSNENEYTNLWRGPYYGYRDVLETFKRTGSPRRLKPVDVYVHFYSAEKIASLKVLQDVYDWARREPLFPISAGQYSALAAESFEMRLFDLGPGRWRVEGAPLVRTVRFDGEAREPDLARSRGVVGFAREGGSLFVSLDESEAREIDLAERPQPLPHIAEANFDVSDFRREGGGLAFLRSGWWKGELVLGGLAPGRPYRVLSGGSELRGQAGADGRLRVAFPDSELGGAGREVKVEPL